MILHDFLIFPVLVNSKTPIATNTNLYNAVPWIGNTMCMGEKKTNKRKNKPLSLLRTVLTANFRFILAQDVLMVCSYGRARTLKFCHFPYSAEPGVLGHVCTASFPTYFVGTGATGQLHVDDVIQNK